MRTALRWIEGVFFAIAALCLLSTTYARWDAARYDAAAHELALAADSAIVDREGRQGRTSETNLPDATRSIPVAPDEAVVDGPPPFPRATSGLSSHLIGELAIPHLGIATAILEGDGAGELRRGAGHLPGTAMPGQPGNVVLAGHRDTVFRRLSQIQRGDRLKVTTAQGTFNYRVTRTLRVAPKDIWVLRRDAASLTLITCYPFTWVGSAPERWVVQAESVRHEGIW